MAQLKINLNGVTLPLTMWGVAQGSLIYAIDYSNLPSYVVVSGQDDYSDYQTNLLTYARQFYINGEEATITFETI
jgi:hypothetical protein